MSCFNFFAIFFLSKYISALIISFFHDNIGRYIFQSKKVFLISIGPNLKKYRMAAVFSYEVVATKLQAQGLDISRKIVSQMESGKYSVRVSVLLALAKLYHMPVQKFFANLILYQ